MIEVKLKKNHEAFQVTTTTTLDDLPKWASEYRGYQPVSGATFVFFDPTKTLKVPDGKGFTSAHATDWLVWDGKKIIVMKHPDFDAYYEEVSPNDASA